MESPIIQSHKEKANEDNEDFDRDNSRFRPIDGKEFFCKKHQTHEDAAIRIVKEVYGIDGDRRVLESKGRVRWSSRVGAATKKGNAAMGNPLVLPRSINDELIPLTYAQIEAILKKVETQKVEENVRQEIIEALFTEPKDSISIARKHLFGI